MDRETKLSLDALADAISAQFASLPAGQQLTFPAPQIHVNVDMKPVADALERMTAGFAAVFAELASLIEVVAQKTAKVSPPDDGGFDIIVPMNRDPQTGMAEYYEKQRRNGKMGQDSN